MNEPQIIEIGLSNTVSSPKLSVLGSGDIGSIKLMSSKKSVNFGPGAEMLMNQNKVSSSPKSDLPLADLNSLELNISEKPPKEKASDIRNKVFGINEPKSILKSPSKIVEPILKNATEKSKDSTWDGFQKFNDIPVNPEAKPPSTPAMTSEQLLKEKLLYLRKLGRFGEKRRIRLTKRYNMDTNLLNEMMGEYETDYQRERERANSVLNFKEK